MKICIDAGHNYSGYNTGACGCGLREQNITFYIANKLRTLFENIGINVVMTRPSLRTNCGNSNSGSISYRYTLANKNNCDLFISIHCNAYNGLSKGTETLIYRQGTESEKVAVSVQNKIVEKLKTADRGVKVRTDLGVLANTKMSAILIETAFIDNADDAKLLNHNQADFAQAIFDGVCSVYGLEVKNMPNKYSYDDTVDNMISDGITTVDNMQYWEQVLAGKEPVNIEYVRKILDKYHAAVK